MSRTISKNVVVILGLAAMVGLTILDKPNEGVLSFLMAILVRPHPES